jgi:aspartyl-tRNA(Asn)/glutamyl-tRNA(Gln) amidotransferase subunit A
LDLCDMPAHDLAVLMGAGEVRPSDVMRSALARTESVESAVRAYVTIDADRALQSAIALDARARDGSPRLPVWGAPACVKDNICTKDLPTTCASKILQGYRPPYDATAVARLRKAGAVTVGKTNLDEFGMGSSTEHSAVGPTANPWDTTRVPGGSSGGAAAAVAAGEAVLALASDTGGSVRLPASFCGVVGFRPTYGAVSRYGLVAYASSMDQIGMIARDALDCGLLFAAVAGPDGADATAAPRRAPSGASAFATGREVGRGADRLKGLRVGVPFSTLGDRVDADVKGRFEDALDALSGAGAAIEEVELLDPSYALAAYYVIADCEASSNLARYDGARYGRRVEGECADEMYVETRSAFLGEEVKRRIILGTFALSAGYWDRYYLKASRVRHIILRDYAAAAGGADVLATPTAASPAFAAGERLDDPVSMYASDVFTVGPSLAGLPCVSLPMGLSTDGLPLGLQLIGKAGRDWDLLEAAHGYQCVTDHHALRPPLERHPPPGAGEGPLV